MSKPEYLNKQLASKYSGLSVRRLLELASQGKIRRIYTRDPKSKRDIAGFLAEDIHALRDRPPAALEKWSPARSPAALPRPSAAPQTDDGHVIQRPWLTVTEACQHRF